MRNWWVRSSKYKIYLAVSPLGFIFFKAIGKCQFETVVTLSSRNSMAETKAKESNTSTSSSFLEVLLKCTFNMPLSLRSDFTSFGSDSMQLALLRNLPAPSWMEDIHKQSYRRDWHAVPVTTRCTAHCFFTLVQWAAC